jgi:hypothetical protein
MDEALRALDGDHRLTNGAEVLAPEQWVYLYR